MKKLLLLIGCALTLQVSFAQSGRCYTPPLLGPMPQHSRYDCWTEGRGMLALKEKDKKGKVKEVVRAGASQAVLYEFDGDVAKKPTQKAVMTYYATLIQKQGGKVLFLDSNRVDASLQKESSHYWINVAYATNGKLRITTLEDGTQQVVDSAVPPVD